MFSANTSQVSNDVKYIEDFFSAWLRTGTGSSQTVTTGIKENTGALVISKSRSAATDWAWYDTFRGATKDLVSNSTAAETTQSQGLTAFNTDGHTWGTLAKVNTSGATYVDFVLKPTPKFFDVVTWTGDGASSRAISHSLGSAPGCIIVKKTSGTQSWFVYHRSDPTSGGVLNTTQAFDTGFNIVSATSSTTFTIYTTNQTVNTNGDTYVAYLFAHNAGGFGLTGTDNVISCGSFTTDTSGNATVNLGYEPQWVLTKRVDQAASWVINDNMRGMPASQTSQVLYPNLSNAESSSIYFSTQPNATGFTTQNYANTSYDGVAATVIYIAIRRGPMKTPTSGTSVFSPSVRASGTGAAVSTTGVGFPPDLLISSERTTGVLFTKGWHDRLRGNVILRSDVTNNEAADSTGVTAYGQDGFSFGTDGGFATVNYSGSNYVYEAFRRAPGFFDEVCYTGTGANQVVTHNLGVTPELIFIKARTDTTAWNVYASAVGSGKRLFLNTTDAVNTLDGYAALSPTTFTTGVSAQVCGVGNNYVAYLFASCPGVSKGGSYTGNGSTQTINCGFTGGARFVLIKRTDSTGDWYVWDTARGIVAGNDPYLLLNSTAAEVTTTDYIDPVSSGFEISSTAPTAINANGGTFIYLAIA